MRHLDLVVANAVGVTRGEPNAERLLHHCATLTPEVGIVGMVESDDVAQRDGLVGPDLPESWQVWHRGPSRSQDGVLLAYDRDRVALEDGRPPRWHLGTRSALPGLPRGEFVDRWWLVADLVLDYDTPLERFRRVVVGHLPTRTNHPAYWDAMARQMRTLNPDHALADWNRGRVALAQAFPKRQVVCPPEDVMGVVSRRHAKARRPRTTRTPLSDHLVLCVSV